MDFGEDIYQFLEPSLLEHDIEKKWLCARHCAKHTLPEYTNYFERLLAKKGSIGFVFGNALSIANLKLYCLFDWLTSGILDWIPTDLFDSYENISAWRKNIDVVREAR